MPSHADLKQQLADVRARAHKARIASVVDYAPIVCGVRLKPITFQTYQYLLAFENGFVTGGSCDLLAILQFVWVHHPDFSQFAERRRLRVMREAYCALRPRFPRLNLLATFFQSWPRLHWLHHFVVPSAATRQEEAVVEIRRLLEEALGDFPVGGDEDDPLPYSMYPRIIGLLERSHSITCTEARALVDAMPLKQLVQWIREAAWRASRGKDKLLTAAESELWCQWLDEKQASVDSAAAKTE